MGLHGRPWWALQSLRQDRCTSSLAARDRLVWMPPGHAGHMSKKLNLLLAQEHSGTKKTNDNVGQRPIL